MRVCPKKRTILIPGILILIFGLPVLSLDWPVRSGLTHRRMYSYHCFADEYNPFSRDLGNGVFLVASRQLLDPNFSQTVVILIEYGSDGAVGLIINRQSDIRLSKVLPDMKALRKRKDTVFIGGPVGVDQLLILVHSGSVPEDSYRVIEDVYVISNLDVLGDMVKQKGSGGEFRAYAGYAGWSAGQLDSEVARGDWYVITADTESIFSQAPQEVWPRLTERSTAQWTKAIEHTAERASIPVEVASNNE
jgi:putative transcriptional regulator